MKNQPIGVSSAAQDATHRLTVVGLFEEVIDANHALSDLREAEVTPETVSMIVREKVRHDTDEQLQAADVATALSDLALDQAGEWLLHLVSLTIPNEGAFLVAGPIGAILADVESVTRTDEPTPQSTPYRSSSQPLVGCLVRFGYGDDEAEYLSQRVSAGSVLVAVTTLHPDQAGEARRVFADQGAVHIGTNWTEAETVAHAESLVHTPADVTSDEKVVVFDSVSLLVGLCRHENPELAASCGGAPVVDREGDDVGVVEDLLAEIQNGGAGPTDIVHIRYVVIGFGGLLGIGKSFVAVPAAHVTLDADPIELSVLRQKVHSAPQYATNRPFSRRDEEIVCDHFGCPHYWL